MKIKNPEIATAKHGQLLYRVGGASAGDERVKQLERELKDYLVRYQGQLAEISETLRCYFTTAEDIKRALPGSGRG